MTDEYEKEDDEEYEDDEVTSESDEEYEDEAEDAEASDESEAGEEGDESVASWGYEEKKSRFSKEVIAGFAAVALLVTIFGVVVYKKFPGADSSAEAITAGPDVSLGNPGDASSEADPNDPFALGAGDALGQQTEPNPADAPSEDLLAGVEPGTGDFGNAELTTSGANAAGASTETASLFPDQPGSSGPNSSDPFATSTDSADLFAGQTEPTTGSEAVDPFETASTTDQFGAPQENNGVSTFSPEQPDPLSGQPASTTDDRRSVFGGPSNEFADSGTTDPFASPDLSGSSTSSADTASSLDPLGSFEPTGSETSFGTPEFPAATDGSLIGSESAGTTSGDSVGADPFAPGSELVQNEPALGGTLGTMSNDPIGTTISEPLPGDPFGSTGEPASSTLDSGSTLNPGSSEPGGLFDRGPSNALSENNGNGTGLNGLPDSSVNPGLRSDAMRSLNNAIVENGSSETASDPFGSTNSGVSSDSDSGSTFDPGSGDPSSLFPDNGPGGSATVSNDPFQPPLTSSPVRSSPSTLSSDLTGGSSISSGASASSTNVTGRSPNSGNGNGGTYTVQEGDSYWNISKKVYGTAKYFQVLADLNQGTIADPQKMKAGTVIQTPDASFLQSQLKTVRRTAPTGLTGSIETDGRADRTGTIDSDDSSASNAETVVVSRRPAIQDEPSGILFNQQGYPMFRIGETDTLTSIAADHLGRASRWEQIYNMNRDRLQSPDKLQIGMVLKLPADASRVPLIDRTSSLR